MKDYIPPTCPACGSGLWKEVAINQTKQPISGGKALLGGALFGPVGLAAGLLGKKHWYKTMYCSKCGFTHAYEF